LYFHHNWDNWQDHLDRTFPGIKDHVLLERATQLSEAAAEINSLISENTFKDIVANIPEDWLEGASSLTPTEKRRAYIDFLNSRLDKIEILAKQASDAK
jgi:hypothetical protein